MPLTPEEEEELKQLEALAEISQLQEKGQAPAVTEPTTTEPVAVPAESEKPTAAPLIDEYAPEGVRYGALKYSKDQRSPISASAAARLYGKGFTYGLQPKLSAVMESGVIAPIAHATGLGPDVTYEEALKGQKEEIMKAEKEAGKAAPLIEAAGALTQPLGWITGSSLPAAIGTVAATRGITEAGQMEEPVFSKEGVKKIGEAMLPKADLQSALEYGLPIAGAGVSKFVSKAATAAPKFERHASEAALRSLGATSTQVENLLRTGRLYKLGDFLIKEKLLGGDPYKVLTKIQKLKEEIGPQVDHMLTYIDNVINELAPAQRQQFQFNLRNVLKQIDNEIITPLKKIGDPSQILPDLEMLLLNYRDMAAAGRTFTLKEARELNTQLRKSIRFFRKSESPMQDALEKVSGIIKDELHNTVDKSSTLLHNTEIAKDFSKINQRYSNLSDAEDIITSAYARQVATPPDIGLAEVGGAVAGHALGGPFWATMGGLGVVGARRFGRVYEPLLSTKIHSKISEVLKNTPEKFGKYAAILNEASKKGAGALTATIQTLAAQDPQFKQDLNSMDIDVEKTPSTSIDKILTLLETNPEALGSFATPFQKAIERGPDAFTSTYYILSQQDPEFRKFIETLDKSESPNKEKE